MDMEVIKDIALFVLTGFGAIVAWMFKDVRAKVEETSKELAEHKLHVAQNYVNQTDLTEAMSGIKEVLGGMSHQIKSLTEDFKAFTVRVYDKLDSKADKL